MTSNEKWTKKHAAALVATVALGFSAGACGGTDTPGSRQPPATIAPVPPRTTTTIVDEDFADNEFKWLNDPGSSLNDGRWSLSMPAGFSFEAFNGDGVIAKHPKAAQLAQSAVFHPEDFTAVGFTCHFAEQHLGDLDQPGIIWYGLGIGPKGATILKKENTVEGDLKVLGSDPKVKLGTKPVQIQAWCWTEENGSVTLDLLVDGKHVVHAIDAKNALPPGGFGFSGQAKSILEADSSDKVFSVDDYKVDVGAKSS